jgi:hypothetical protein
LDSSVLSCSESDDSQEVIVWKSKCHRPIAKAKTDEEENLLQFSETINSVSCRAEGR